MNVSVQLPDEQYTLRPGVHGLVEFGELIGEPLWLALGDPGRRPPKQQDLATYVEALERL